MATRARLATQDRHELFTELVDGLRELRGGERPDRMAGRLLRHATDGTELVALVNGGERAVCYDAYDRSVYSLPFDADGVDENGKRTLWRYVGDAGSWIDAHRGEIDWLNPAYHWALDLDGSTWYYVQ